MKIGITQYQPVIFDYDLDTVSKVEFIFKQGKTVRIVDYPSEEAIRRDGKNIIDIKFSAEETYRWKSNEAILMDTRIHVKDSDTMPQTPIIPIKMNSTLFEDHGV